MTVSYSNLTFELLAHASVHIETDGGQVVYVDPWSDVLDGQPHDADVVFSTHDDRDHYDADAIRAVAGDDTDVVVYKAINTSDLGLDVTPIDVGETLTAGDVKARAVPAYNRPGGNHVDENGDPFHAEGEVIGLVLMIEGTTVYYPSDTDFLDEHADIQADVFVPPIGGSYTMDRHEAADFAESVDPSLVLPVHYDTFEAIETDAEAFARDLEERGIMVELF